MKKQMQIMIKQKTKQNRVNYTPNQSNSINKYNNIITKNKITIHLQQNKE